jgi:hypothetical protein
MVDMILGYKTVTENWVMKAPSVGTILAYLETIIFFRNKTFFVFQDRKLKCSASDENKISTHLDNLYFHFFYRLSD